MKTKGLTLLEVMIVVAIIGLVAAIAIPAVTRLAENVRADICRTNLNTIDKSKMQWAFDNNKSDTDEPTEDDLKPYVAGDVPTHCAVAGALYDIGNVITPALCSFHGNGFRGGLGLSLPQDLIDLVESGQIDASTVVDGEWSWEDIPGMEATYFNTKNETHSLNVEQEFIVSAEPPHITINGVVLTGDIIDHYGADFAGRLKAASEDQRGMDHHIDMVSRMEKGGYEVVNYVQNGRWDTYTEHYYDHEGNLLGYSEVSPEESKYYYN